MTISLAGEWERQSRVNLVRLRRRHVIIPARKLLPPTLFVIKLMLFTVVAAPNQRHTPHRWFNRGPRSSHIQNRPSAPLSHRHRARQARTP